MPNPSNRKSGTQSQKEPSARLTSWVVVFVAVITVVAFLPVTQNGFVNWDDDRNLLENPHYRGLGWAQLRWMFTTFHMGHYQPLSWLTFAFDYLLWGMDPFGYHLTNLLLHTTNGVLFYLLTLRLLSLAFSVTASSKDLGFRAAAGLAALIFAIHPLRVESVAWATQRRDVLSALFFLATILCYLRATTVENGSSYRWRWMSIALIAYCLSLLSKAAGVTLPVVLLVLDIYPLRRLGGSPRNWFSGAARRVLWEKAPFLLLALGAGVIAPLAQYEAGALQPLDVHGAVPRLAQALYGLAFYLWKTVLPRNLSPLYELPTRFNAWDWPFLLAEVVVVAVSIGLFVMRRRRPAGLASWVCYMVILAPVLGITQSGPQMVADRYTYLSCLGWAVLSGAGLVCCRQLWTSGHIRSRTFALTSGVAVALLSGLGVLTWKQTQVWHDSETLWRHALSVERKSSYVHNSLGSALFVRGELEEAIEHFRRALQIDPAFAKAHHNLGVALARRGELEEAIEHFRRALQIDPVYAKAHHNLGVALARRGELGEAIEHFQQALRVEPEFAEAHQNLALALVQQGRKDEAAKYLHEAIRIMKSRLEADVPR
jgi:tetratricopeptide (TPR) repeat protein